jgi:Calcineurin-like phosphoesterase/F5/8 type C domain
MLTPFGNLPNRFAVDMTMAEQHEWLAHRVSRRSILVATAGIGLTSAASLLLGSTAEAATATGLLGRQLAYGADPTKQMTVAFAVTSTFTTAVVQLRLGGAAVAQASASVATAAGSATRFARTTFSGLQPGTTYTYVIIIDGVSVSTGTFQTAAAGPHAFRFTAFGDQATTSNVAPVLAQVAALKPSVHLFAGDLSYADESGQGGVGDVFKPVIWDGWVRQNDPVASQIPWMCAMGNHEMEPGFGTHGYAGVLTRVAFGGSSPLAVPVASTFQVGTVGFIALDSNDVTYEFQANRGWTHGAQTTWLQQALMAMRTAGSGIDFIVVYMHASPYSTNMGHASDAGVRDAWGKLFDSYQVDVVISGHNHCYERTLPIRAGQPTATTAASVDSSKGTSYITAGGGGSSTTSTAFYPGTTSSVITAAGRATEAAPWRLRLSANPVYSVLSVDVAPATTAGQQTTLTLRALDQTGKLFDSAVLYRTATVGTVAVAAADIAQGRPATQSSTAGTASASLAVNGSTNGAPGSVSATNVSVDPWWQVDLGQTNLISTIKITGPSTPAAASSLSNYWIFLANKPINTTLTPIQQSQVTGVYARHVTAAPNPTSTQTFPKGASARYVMVQLDPVPAANGSPMSLALQLAEVQIYS